MSMEQRLADEIRKQQAQIKHLRHGKGITSKQLGEARKWLKRLAEKAPCTCASGACDRCSALKTLPKNQVIRMQGGEVEWVTGKILQKKLRGQR